MGREIDTDRTDSSGSFTFRDLAPGGYQLQVGNQEPVPVTLAADTKRSESIRWWCTSLSNQHFAASDAEAVDRGSSAGLLALGALKAVLPKFP